MEGYKHKVQYYETDQMGIVHHSNYIRWFEEARTDFMEKMGLGYEEMEKQGILSPVLSVDATYLRMVRFGDTVTIHTKIKAYNGIKLTVAYEVCNDKTGMVHCKGTSSHCFLTQMGQPISLKKDMIEFHELFAKGLEDSKKQNNKENKGKEEE